MFPFGWPPFQVKVLKSLSQTSFLFVKGTKFQSQCKYISLNVNVNVSCAGLQDLTWFEHICRPVNC